MADYIKREDAKIILQRAWIEDPFRRQEAFDELNSIPSAYVVEVVRCKDCRHRDPEDHKCDCGQFERAGCVFPVDDDYFCFYGERREDG